MSEKRIQFAPASRDASLALQANAGAQQAKTQAETARDEAVQVGETLQGAVDQAQEFSDALQPALNAVDQATTGANNAADNADAKAILANDAATNANQIADARLSIDKYNDVPINSLLPRNSWFDILTPVTLSTAGVFSIRGTIGGSPTLSKGDNQIIVTSDTGNIIFENLDVISEIPNGDDVYYRFEARRVSGTGNLFIAFGNTAPSSNADAVALTSEFQTFEGALPKGTVNANRTAFLATAVNNLVYEIRNLIISDEPIQIELGIKTDIENLQPLLPVIGLELPSFPNVVPENSRLDEDTEVTATTAGGWISWRAATFSKNESEDAVTVSPDGQVASGLRFPTLLAPFAKNQPFDVTFEARHLDIAQSISVFIEQGPATATAVLTSNFQEFKFENIMRGSEFNDGRVTIGIASGANTTDFEIRNIVFRIRGAFEKLDDRVTLLESGGLEGLRVSILGDSISTALGNNAPELTILASDVGNELSAYPTEGDVSAGLVVGGITITTAMLGTEVTFTPTSGDVGKVIGRALNFNSLPAGAVWWERMISALNMEQCQNASFSGSAYTRNRASQDAYKTSYAWHPSMIRRLAKRDANGNPINPDVVIIYRGTNDYSVAGALLTDYDQNALSIPADDTVDGGFGFKEAIAITVEKVREAYPLADVFLCTLNIFKRGTATEFPVQTSRGSIPQFNKAIREMADFMGCGIIEFDKSGITFENLTPTYCSEVTNPTHPNATGHAKLASRAIKDLSLKYSSV